MVPVAAVVLGVVLLAAGIGKLLSPTWPEQAAQLGAPAVAVPTVPWIEVVLGALLVTGVARRPAAVAAGSLLGAFTALVAVRLAQGRRPPCACFGGRSTRPIGAWTIVRNVAMVLLALIVVAS